MNTELNSSKIVETSQSNFSHSFFFLSKEQRKAISVIYAYCRLTDDMVDLADNSSTNEPVKNQLENWRLETVKSFQQKSSHPLLQELLTIVQKYQIPQDYFFQLIEGVKMDLEKNSYSSFAELYSYCYRVASVVGLICLKIFGCKHSFSREFAINLGIAFQLTNILRDIKTDSQRGRIYIPQEDLKRFSLQKEEFLYLGTSFGEEIEAESSEKIKQLKNLIIFESWRAERYYEAAKDSLVKEDRPHLIAAEVMCAIYHSILKKIRRNPLGSFNKKIKLSKLELSFSVFGGWLTNRLGL